MFRDVRIEEYEAAACMPEWVQCFNNAPELALAEKPAELPPVNNDSEPETAEDNKRKADVLLKLRLHGVQQKGAKP